MLRQSFLPNHLDLGMCYNNITNTYNEMKKLSKAIFYYHEKDLKIGGENYRDNDPHLADFCFNIRTVYFNADQYSKALSWDRRPLEI